MIPMDTALAIEVKYFIRLQNDPRSQAMIRTLFVNKQAAEKGAGRPKNIDKVDIKAAWMSLCWTGRWKTRKKP